MRLPQPSRATASAVTSPTVTRTHDPAAAAELVGDSQILCQGHEVPSRRRGGERDDVDGAVDHAADEPIGGLTVGREAPPVHGDVDHLAAGSGKGIGQVRHLLAVALHHDALPGDLVAQVLEDLARPGISGDPVHIDAGGRRCTAGLGTTGHDQLGHVHRGRRAPRPAPPTRPRRSTNARPGWS